MGTTKNHHEAGERGYRVQPHASESTGKSTQTNVGIEHVCIFESVWRNFGPPERFRAVSDQVEQRPTLCTKGKW